MNSLWPADRVERRPIAWFRPYDRNARTHSVEQVEQIAASMREWGWTIPILADETGGIIAGHGRLLAAQSLGFREAPVMVAEGWTDAQKQAYRLADNQLTLNGAWDFGILGEELQALQKWNFDLGLLGFSDIDSLLQGNGPWLTEPDVVLPLPERPISQLGDVWLLDKHRLVCGDATDKNYVDRALNGIEPHLMVTDPPYGVNYDPEWRAVAGINKNKQRLGTVENDNCVDWRQAWELFTGSVIYCWHAGRHASQVQNSLEATGFEIVCQIIWAKDRFALSRGDYHWQHEPCWYAVRKQHKHNWSGSRSQSTLWSIPTREDIGHGHGTQKPVECMKRPIENNSSPGQAIYDPFVGSGTSIIAAEMIGRACHAIEINPAYVDVCVKRWQDFTGKIARSERDSMAFNDIEHSKTRGMA